MWSLLLLAVIVAAIFIYSQYRRQKAEQQLRENPPQRAVFQVSLPREVNNSILAMPQFWRSVASATIAEGKERKAGKGQIDFAYWISKEGEGATPLLRCLIYTDPESLDRVKRAIKQVYASSGQIQVVQLDEDPLAGLAERVDVKPEAREPEAIGAPE